MTTSQSFRKRNNTSKSRSYRGKRARVPQQRRSQQREPAVAEPAAASAPHDPDAGLGEHEVKTILDYKKKHPSMGPAQIRAQLKQFLGWRVSVKAIA